MPCAIYHENVCTEQHSCGNNQTEILIFKNTTQCVIDVSTVSRLIV